VKNVLIIKLFLFVDSASLRCSLSFYTFPHQSIQSFVLIFTSGPFIVHNLLAIKFDADELLALAKD